MIGDLCGRALRIAGGGAARVAAMAGASVVASRATVLAFGLGLTGAVAAQSTDLRDVSFPDPAPKAPAEADLVEYHASPSTRNRFLIDLASLSLGEQDSVRFTTVIETPSGVRNIRHEAFRCHMGDRRMLAIARADGSWSLTPGSGWQGVSRSDTNLGYFDLFKALCFGGPKADRELVVERIRTGRKLQNF